MEDHEGFYEDDDYGEEDEDICPHCQNSGRVPSDDYDAILGINYYACRYCEHGLQYPDIS